MTALALGQYVMFRSTYEGSNVFGANILAQPPLIGYVIDLVGSTVSVLWNNGKVTTGIVADVTNPNAIPVLKLTPSPSPQFQYATVRSTVNNQSPWFIGQVFAKLAIQRVPTADPDAFVDHVIVHTPEGLFWIAPNSDVEEVPGR